MDYPKNISRKELLRSATAHELRIKNEPTNRDEANLIRLANWLQKLRDELAKFYGREIKLYIRSGYRSKVLNEMVNGSKTSAHVKGLAADIHTKELSSYELTKFIISYMEDYDQVIEEFGIYVHVGLSRRRPREQALKATKVGKKTVYSVF